MTCEKNTMPGKQNDETSRSSRGGQSTLVVLVEKGNATMERQ